MNKLLVIVALAACGQNKAAGPATTPSSNAPAEANTWKPRVPKGPSIADAVRHPEWLGTTVTLEIREDIVSSRESGVGPYLGYLIDVPDSGDRLALAPAEDEAEGMVDLGEVRPPVLVTGMLRKAENWIELVPAKIEQLEFEAPLELASPEEVFTDTRVTPGTRIETTDVWRIGMESSTLGSLWLGKYRSATVRCRPAGFQGEWDKTVKARVRVVGLVYNAPGHHYGHLGGYTAKLEATEIEFLDPTEPNCPK